MEDAGTRRLSGRVAVVRGQPPAQHTRAGGFEERGRVDCRDTKFMTGLRIQRCNLQLRIDDATSDRFGRPDKCRFQAVAVLFPDVNKLVDVESNRGDKNDKQRRRDPTGPPRAAPARSRTARRCRGRRSRGRSSPTRTRLARAGGSWMTCCGSLTAQDTRRLPE